MVVAKQAFEKCVLNPNQSHTITVTHHGLKAVALSTRILPRIPQVLKPWGILGDLIKNNDEIVFK